MTASFSGDLRRRSLGDLAAFVHHADMVGNIHHDAHVVLDHQDGHAELFLQIEDEARDILALLLVHPRDHFVEQQELRRDGQRPAKLDPLLQAVGQRADRMIADVFDLEKVDDFLDALARLDLFRARSTQENGGGNRIGAQPRVHADQDVVDDGLVLEHREVLEGAGNAEARQRMGRQLREIPPVEKDLAGGWPEHRADQIEECRLAGAVRADQAADLARLRP